MRIGIDARTLSWNWTGPWRYLRNLLRSLARIDDKNEYSLFLLAHEPELMPVQSNFRKTPIGFFTTGNTLLSRLNTGLFSTVIESYLKGQAVDPISGNLHIPVLLKHERIEVFHSPFHVLPFVKACPSVVTIHDLAFEIYPQEFSIWARRFAKIFTPLAARIADVIIVPSTCVKENLVRLYNIPQSKIRVIHEAAEEIFRPIDKQESKREISRKYNISDSYMLFIGFAHLRRNLASLLKSLSVLKKQSRTGHKLVIISRYDYASTNYPRLIKELDIEDDVIHIGHVPDDDLPLFYNAAEIFVYPSSYEGFGLPLVEAMACGTPIVASNAPPMPEIVGTAGLFVDPLNVNEMAQTIDKVLADESLLSRLKERSLERSQSFSWEKTARNTLAAYAEARQRKPAL